MKSYTLNNIIALAVASDLIRCIVMESGGYEIANTVEGKPLNSELLNEVALGSISTLIKNMNEVKSLGAK